MPPLDVAAGLAHSLRHERPQPYLRHLPGDYSLAKLAGCGRLFSRSRSLDARPARPGACLPSTPAGPRRAAPMTLDGPQWNFGSTIRSRAKSGRFGRSIPPACACMCADRRSTTSPISAMRGRSWCSTCCSGCCGISTAPARHLCAQHHRRRRQDQRARGGGISGVAVERGDPHGHAKDRAATTPTSRARRPAARPSSRAPPSISRRCAR